jgi:predicted ribosome quality control (RQC) complex YloA/Tae2 family protein
MNNMEIEIDLTKSVDENAGDYFNLSKKAKKKLEGARDALVRSKKDLVKLEKEEEKFMAIEIKKQAKKEKKREWYEKFHWFISSEGFLCIGGKDATSNEIVIKKHAEKEDLVFHTDMAGSPFFVIKNGQEAGEETIEETAQAVAVYSKAWKVGHSIADVFYVKSEQVTKEAQSGEYMSKGSFMVRGKTKYLHPKLEYSIGLLEDEKGDEIIGGPKTAIKKRTNKFVTIVVGREKKSSLAKKIKAKLKGGDLDDIIKFLPAGGGEIKKK